MRWNPRKRSLVGICTGHLQFKHLEHRAIVGAASKLHLTVTEFLTKSALMVAEKVRK